MGVVWGTLWGGCCPARGHLPAVLTATGHVYGCLYGRVCGEIDQAVAVLLSPACSAFPVHTLRTHHSFTPLPAHPSCSITAWGQGLPNVRPPLQLDASAPAGWGVPGGACRALYCANMCHISPWSCTVGLLAGAARVLQPGGELFLYGPFSVNGRPTTESNAAFDATLRQRNPAWGYRDVADVEALAAAAGLSFVERREMPANNFMLIYRKQQQA